MSEPTPPTPAAPSPAAKAAGIGEADQSVEPATPDTSTPVTPKKSFQGAKWVERLSLARSLIVNAVLVVLLIGLLSVFILEARRPTIVLEAVDVPKALVERGYSPAIVTRRIEAHIRQIHWIAKTQFERRPLVPASLQPDVPVPGTGMSVRSAVSFARYVFGIPERRIHGDITEDGDKLRLTFIANVHADVAAASAHATSIDELLELGAQEVVKLTDPYVLASHFFTREKQSDDDFKMTREVIDYCLAHEPPEDNAWAYNLWGLVLMEQGQDEQALEKFAAALRLKPDFSLALGHSGQTLIRLGRRDEGIERFQHAIRLDPQDAASITDWANALVNHPRDTPGDYEQALKKYRRALELRPKEAAVLHSNSCNVLRLLSRHEDAQRSCQQAIDHDPRNASAYHNWGVLHEDQKDCKQAIEKYARAVAINPRQYQSVQAWGNCLQTLGDNDAARQKFLEAAKLQARTGQP